MLIPIISASRDTRLIRSKTHSPMGDKMVHILLPRTSQFSSTSKTIGNMKITSNRRRLLRNNHLTMRRKFTRMFYNHATRHQGQINKLPITNPSHSSHHSLNPWANLARSSQLILSRTIPIIR